MTRINRRLTVALLVCALAGALAGLVLFETGAAARIERATVDARYDVRGKQAAPRDVVVVALDDDTLRRLPDPRLPREIGAQLVRRLSAAGARVVAYDLSLESPRSRAGDRALAGALRAAPRAVVSVTTVDVEGGVQPLLGRIPFERTPVRPGVTLLRVDDDGAVRRFPPPLGPIAPFALVAARLADPAVAAPPDGALVNFPGPAGTVDTLKLADVVEGRFAPAAVRDRVVVIGQTAPLLKDLHETAVDPVMSGPEIQAAAVATALDGFPLRPAAGAVTVAAILALALIALAGPHLWTALGGWRARTRDADAADA